MNKITVYCIVCMFCLLPEIHARDRYAPGYIVLNTGDTLYGQIRDRDLSRDKIYPKIRFRSKDTGRKRFSAYQIKAYKVENAEFESVWYEERSAFFQFNYYSRYGQGERIFLRVLERGELTCYYKEYIDYDSGYLDGFELFKREGEDYFERATQGIFGLKKKRLSAYFRDCPSLVEKIQYGEITKPLEVVRYYNNHCSGNIISP